MISRSEFMAAMGIAAAGASSSIDRWVSALITEPSSGYHRGRNRLSQKARRKRARQYASQSYRKGPAK